MSRAALPFQAAVFLGSFLLFEIELIAAKLLLPSFGGAACVWTTCVMFFQGALLLGYLYSRAFLGRVRSARGARLHLLFLLLPFAFFPISAPTAAASGHPWARVLQALLLSVGAPFFVLATTSPMIQNWLSRSEGAEAGSSYAVYGASNAGALAALLSYPFLLEPLLTLKAQILLWEIAYGIFAALHLPCLPREEAEPGSAGTADIKSRLLWLSLSLGPSAAMLAATNLLALDFTAVPLLWVVPLAIYLGTLILSFKRDPWYPERPSLTVAALMLLWSGAVLMTALSPGDSAGRWNAVRRLWVVNKFAFLCAALFMLCLVCHRSLAQRKPAAGRAPQFYAWLAAGGWLGGLWIDALMPWLGRRLGMPELDWAVAGGLCLAVLIFARRERGPKVGLAGVVAAGVLTALSFSLYFAKSAAYAGGVRRSLRNFYGTYAVSEAGGFRKFYHGNTLHGIQYLDPARAQTPLLYYDRGSPWGAIWEDFGSSSKEIGVVGLGAGVIAACGRSGQGIDFYEFDPDVAELARTYFSFLRESRARVRIITGDARLSLRERPASYELLVLDAFSGGAIPVHLLTREAFDLYFSRVSEGGVIAVQITNRLLNLRPVLAALARALDVGGATKAVDPTTVFREEKGYSSWVVLSLDAAKIERLKKAGWEDLRRYDRGSRPWTDQYASLWLALSL